MESGIPVIGPGRTVIGTIAVAAVGAAVAMACMNITPSVSAQPAQRTPDDAPLADIVRKTVIIQYRRDALGLAAQTAPGWTETREGAISVQGDVIAVRSGWIGLRGLEPSGERRDIWVPTHAILSIITR